jgi:hypothetical protein
MSKQKAGFDFEIRIKVILALGLRLQYKWGKSNSDEI